MKTHTNIFQQFYNELKSDSTIDSWPLVNSPWPICIILALYLTFVLKLGPKLMKNREPMNIKYLILFYNLMQTMFNSYIFAYQFIKPEIFNYIWNHACHPDNTKSNIVHELHIASWYFAISKIIDLFDTQTDVYPYLHESFIFLEGTITDATKVKLSNNGYSFLFEQIRLEINGIEVDSTRALGITSSLKGYLSCTPDNYNCYENSGWNFKNATQSENEKGEFSACIPLKYWLDSGRALVN
eukprot:XP_003240858.1 PREDICTED: elongation of very long chain fatty acids protein 1 [Acyrthosiphon pisum]